MEVREEVVAGEEEEDGNRRNLSWSSRRNSLYAKWVAPGPFHFVPGLAVRAHANVLDFFSQPDGSNDAHPALTLLASKDFLQCASLPEVPARRSPPDPMLTTC